MPDPTPRWTGRPPARLTIRVDPAVHQLAQTLMARDGQKFQYIFDAALRNYLAGHRTIVAADRAGELRCEHGHRLPDTCECGGLWLTTDERKATA